MSKEKLFSLWESTSDEKFPSARSKDSPLDPFYPITKYFVKLQDGKPIGAIGYSVNNGFTLRGGAFVIESERGNKIYSELDSHLESNTSGPWIAGISSNTVSNSDWAENFSTRGWDISPSDKQLGKYVNNPTVKGFKDYYTNHPREAKWAVKGLPLAKWFIGLRR